MCIMCIKYMECMQHVRNHEYIGNAPVMRHKCVTNVFIYY